MMNPLEQLVSHVGIYKYDAERESGSRLTDDIYFMKKNKIDPKKIFTLGDDIPKLKDKEIYELIIHEDKEHVLTCDLQKETTQGTTYDVLRVSDEVYENLQKFFMGGDEMVLSCEYLDLPNHKVLKPLENGYIRLIMFRQPDNKKQVVGILSLHSENLKELETIIAKN